MNTRTTAWDERRAARRELIQQLTWMRGQFSERQKFVGYEFAPNPRFEERSGAATAAT